MKYLLFIFTIILFGCSSEISTQEKEPSCQELSGEYRMTFEQTIGDCGSIYPSLINFQYKAPTDPNYVGTIYCEFHEKSRTENNCHYSFDVICPKNSWSHKIITMNIDVKESGESGSGKMHLRVIDDTEKDIFCDSNYNLNFSRN